MDEINRYPIGECSPAAKAKIESYNDPLWAPCFNRRGIYPHGELKIGECFVVPLGEVSDNGMSLRVQTYRRGKMLNRKFAVLKHTDEHQCFEVARIK